MTRDFRKTIQIIPVGLSILLLDAFLAVIWLGTPLHPTLVAEAITAPGLLLLVTSLVYARRITIKLLIITIIVIGRLCSIYLRLVLREIYPGERIASDGRQ
jgi:hypothetical protein